MADLVDESKHTALQAFIHAYALLLDRPADDPVVVQLARAARGLAAAGEKVLEHGHGWLECEIAKGIYLRTNPKLRGPVDLTD
jgi:hypothetical protein